MGRIAEKTSEASVGIGEDEDEGEDDENVASVGDRHAVGVVIDGENRATGIGIVATLVETIATQGEDSVHGDRRTSRIGTQEGDVVHRGVGVRIVDDSERVQRHRGGESEKRMTIFRREDETLRLLPLTEMKNALSTCDTGEQSTESHKSEGGME